MAEYTDFQLQQGEYGKAEEYIDSDAVVLAIRNILLSRPGNFPFNPSIGMNIKKYQFDLLDDQTISSIESELNRQIGQYIPALGGVVVYVTMVNDENDKPYLCISVGADIKGEPTTANFILKQDGANVEVFNEIN